MMLRERKMRVNSSRRYSQELLDLHTLQRPPIPDNLVNKLTFNLSDKVRSQYVGRLRKEYDEWEENGVRIAFTTDFSGLLIPGKTNQLPESVFKLSPPPIRQDAQRVVGNARKQVRGPVVNVSFNGTLGEPVN
jgi:hypothetical protein